MPPSLAGLAAAKLVKPGLVGLGAVVLGETRDFTEVSCAGGSKGGVVCELGAAAAEELL